MSDIVPNEQELKAAGRHSLNDSDCFCNECVFNRAVAIARLTRYQGQDAAYWYAQSAEKHSEILALEASRDAAIAEAVSKRTVECATLADSDKPIQRAILRLNSPPPAPAYPFAQPCRCWEYSKPIEFAESQSNWRRLLSTHSTYDYACPDAAFCEVCGAARKGS
jgi:hypothetical protein